MASLFLPFLLAFAAAADVAVLIARVTAVISVLPPLFPLALVFRVVIVASVYVVFGFDAALLGRLRFLRPPSLVFVI